MIKKEMNIRRCHRCGHTSSKDENSVEVCDSCQRPFSPFYYYDDKYTATLSDCTLRPALIENEFAPIRGLTVFWETKEEDEAS